MQNFGVTSSVARLRRVAVRPPSATADYAAAHWLGAPEAIDIDVLKADHHTFTELLESLGCLVEVLPESLELADAIFVYDPVFMGPRGAIQLQCAKEVRRPEGGLLMRDLGAIGVPMAGALYGDAVADGGDMFWLDERTLAVGRSYRTNNEGVAQLRRIFAQDGIDILTFDLPHALGPDFCLHLMSVISPVRDDLAVVYPAEAPAALLQELAVREIATIEVPAEEYPSLACNVLAVSPGVVVMPDGNPITAGKLRAAGVEVHTYPAAMINRGEGGPTCLTRPIWRV